MQVLSLGMPRMGTSSMQAALQLLGYNETHHGFYLVDRPETSHYWDAATDAKFRGIGRIGKEELDAILCDCAAVSDTPSVFFAEELLAAYPDVGITGPRGTVFVVVIAQN